MVWYDRKPAADQAHFCEKCHRKLSRTDGGKRDHRTLEQPSWYGLVLRTDPNYLHAADTDYASQEGNKPPGENGLSEWGWHPNYLGGASQADLIGDLPTLAVC